MLLIDYFSATPGPVQSPEEMPLLYIIEMSESAKANSQRLQTDNDISKAYGQNQKRSGMIENAFDEKDPRSDVQSVFLY